MSSKNTLKIASFVATVFLFLWTKVIVRYCYSDCEFYYLPNIRILEPFSLNLFIGSGLSLIILAAKFFIIYLLIYFSFYRKDKLLPLRVLFAIALFFLLFYLQNFLYFNHTKQGIVKKSYQIKNDIVYDIIKSENKADIISYVTNDDKYFQTNCFVESINYKNNYVDFINVPEVEEYLGDSKKTTYCEINIEINEDFVKSLTNKKSTDSLEKYLFSKDDYQTKEEKVFNYDCLYIYKKHTSHRVCFKDEKIKALDSTIHNNRWELLFDREFIDNYYLDENVWVTYYNFYGIREDYDIDSYSSSDFMSTVQAQPYRRSTIIDLKKKGEDFYKMNMGSRLEL